MQLDKIRNDYVFNYELVNALKYQNYMQRILEIPTYNKFLDDLVPVWEDDHVHQTVIMSYEMFNDK
jgi:hypothetical protein